MTPAPIRGSPGPCASTTARQLPTALPVSLLVASELANQFTDKPVHIAGIGQATGRPLHDAEALTSLSAAKIASAQAYEIAGIGPEQVGVAEVHDCFTIAEIVASEDLGFFAPRRGPARGGTKAARLATVIAPSTPAAV